MAAVARAARHAQAPTPSSTPPRIAGNTPRRGRIGIKQLQRLLPVSRPTIDKLENEGLLPPSHILLGRRWWWDDPTLASMLNNLPVYQRPTNNNNNPST
jgi:hypothetical protein